MCIGCEVGMEIGVNVNVSSFEVGDVFVQDQIDGTGYTSDKQNPCSV
jgi:hypothetical protein